MTDTSERVVPGIDSPTGSADGVYRYHLLRAALERFQCDLAGLDTAQLRLAQAQAQQTYGLERRVLSSGEAADVVIPAQRLQDAVETLRARYPDQQTFTTELARNGLDEHSLRQALQRELAFDAVLQRIAGRAPPVSEVDAQIFYELHREDFQAPERRDARHILITINPDHDENQREAAYARIAGIADTLKRDPDAFESLAKRYSECPTALQGGLIGPVAPGQLFPELDWALFLLEVGVISDILETALGFHLLICDRISPSDTIPFEAARAKIHQLLGNRRARSAQTEWIASLN
ncbi:nitrogen fixation protein NifM [Thiocapsa imhoffii]|uniref:peptidylprolyl isomerase n=1 Tax=Thiocapsa imhoffii TaxID=382777 RepID=A0A9X0WG76_9GAMM|nr:nitrogen fixation protein NifM [Thiocapsa imhoffii]MBK1643978.1 nitrogen fixation protein NifM [Thiocapsa imhoffii]